MQTIVIWAAGASRRHTTIGCILDTVVGNTAIRETICDMFCPADSDCSYGECDLQTDTMTYAYALYVQP